MTGEEWVRVLSLLLNEHRADLLACSRLALRQLLSRTSPSHRLVSGLLAL